MGPQPTTKHHIWKSFHTLMSTTPFDKITVEMIIRESGVSKSTFYRYFKDKYDVLNYNSMEIAEQLINRKVCRSWKEFLENMFLAIWQNLDYFRKAFRSSGQNAHSGFLFFYSFHIVESCYLQHTRTKALSIHDRYVISHYCHGCVGILQDWLNEPDIMTPEQIAGIFYESMPDYLKDTWE